MIEIKPLVSIIIPCYNHASFVQQTIKSVIYQDYNNIELIIIDDGSKDDSVECINLLVNDCRKRFKNFIFKHRENKGLCKTLNEAIEICSGKYVCCLASDDVILKDKISFQVEYLEANINSLGVFGGVEIIGNNKKIILNRKKSVSYFFDEIYLHKHMLLAPTQMLRLKAVKDVGGFKEDFLIEDWSMWLALTKNGGSLDCVNKIFAKYRRHSGNLSSKAELMHFGRMQIIDFYRCDKYDEGFSRVHLIYAKEISCKNFRGSIDNLFKAIKIKNRIIFSLIFYKVLIYSLINGFISLRR